MSRPKSSALHPTRISSNIDKAEARVKHSRPSAPRTVQPGHSRAQPAEPCNGVECKPSEPEAMPRTQSARKRRTQSPHEVVTGWALRLKKQYGQFDQQAANRPARTLNATLLPRRKSA